MFNLYNNLEPETWDNRTSGSGMLPPRHSHLLSIERNSLFRLDDDGNNQVVHKSHIKIVCYSVSSKSVTSEYKQKRGVFEPFTPLFNA